MPFGTMMLIALASLILGGIGEGWLWSLRRTRRALLVLILAILVLHHVVAQDPALDRVFLLLGALTAVPAFVAGRLSAFSLLLLYAVGRLAAVAALYRPPEPWLSIPLSVAAVATLLPLSRRTALAAATASVAILALHDDTMSVEAGVQMVFATLALSYLATSLFWRLRVAFRPEEE
jgi:hypothetical protein